MRKLLLSILFELFIVTAFQSEAFCNQIKIGFNLPLTGDNPEIGISSKNTAELFLKNHPTIKVGGKQYQLRFIYADNQYSPQTAVKVTTRLITKDRVLAIIGPQASSQAIPAGEQANNFNTPMISPWSSNPATTRNRTYVFRAAFLNPFQGPILTVFSADELGARTAAVLYDSKADYSTEMARYFKMAFEKLLGKGSVVAFESFKTGDKNLSSQLQNIIASDADVLFIPQYYSEIPLIVRAAQKMGWTKPIFGSDSWGGGDLLKLCGDDCKGYYFLTHYTAAGAKGKTKYFIDLYKTAYHKIPDAVAALTWDAIGLLIQGIKNIGGLNYEVEVNRRNIKDGLVSVKNYPGVTGPITLTLEGDPNKCAVIVKISNKNKLEFYQLICPR